MPSVGAGERHVESGRASGEREGVDPWGRGHGLGPGFEELNVGVRARLIRRANGEIARRLREDESRGDDSNGTEEESEVDDAEEAPQGGGESEADEGGKAPGD